VAGILHAFMDARYEGPNLSRFLSEDPSFLALGDSTFAQMAPASSFTQDNVLPGLQSFIPALSSSAVNNSAAMTSAAADPQSLNSYSYAENNPKKYKDPNGKTAEIVYIYAGHTAYLGAHAFILITPKSWTTIAANPWYPGQQQLTISAEPTGPFYAPGALQLQIDNSDSSVPPSQYLERDPIFAPLGITQQQYDEGLVRFARTKVAEGSILDAHYNGPGYSTVHRGFKLKQCSYEPD
jgi:hypothetical protein